MTEGFSPASSSRCHRILIADKDFSTLESLTNTLGDRRLDVDFQLCTSHNSAALKLFRSSYELIICAAHFAEIDNFYLLRQLQTLRPQVPLVVTASASHQGTARRVLIQGAFDVITTPLDHEQTVGTIRLGLWHNQLMTLMSCKEKAVEKSKEIIDLLSILEVKTKGNLTTEEQTVLRDMLYALRMKYVSLTSK